jgi:sterol 3beta-glucosyltransferase
VNIGLQTWGTEGDVRPFVALAAGLSAAGHHVTLAVTEIRNTDFSEYGKDLRFSIRRVGRLSCDGDRLKAIVHQAFHEKNPAKQGLLVSTHFFDPAVEDMLAAARRLCEENDLVVGHFFMWPLKIAARQSGCPKATVYTTPIIPSPRLPPPGMGDYGRLWNAFWWRVTDAVLNRTWKPPIDRVYRREGLAPEKSLLRDIYSSEWLNLVSVSPTLFPPPPDWQDRFHVCGFLNLAEDGQSWDFPDDLRRFLEAGPPPVYLTFGSMLASEPNPLEITTLMINAVKKAGTRAIIQSKWDELGAIETPPEIFCITRAPHQQVFPHCAAVVHHGGAGTTQSALGAGRPSVIVAHASDQPLWGSILQRAGAAPKFLLRRSVTAEKLADAIRAACNSPEMALKAAHIGQKMNDEDGVRRAIELIEAASASRAPGRDTEQP